jgi:UDP-GlcNAc:undecaprenyl-phosphate GlcNAc-1-phosphate transferase
MISLTIATLGFVSTLLVLLVLVRLAPSLGLMDQPGGRKDHASQTPVVGGMAITLVFIFALLVLPAQPWWVRSLAILMLLVVGVLDDIHDLPPLPKLLVQAGAALLMFYAADVKLMSVGNLLGHGAIGTSHFAPLITVFAVIGVINAVNMADGIDGHAGALSLITFLAYAYVARESALFDQYKLLLALAGGVAAFLALNTRSPWLKQARTFLGDSGSMMLGFIIACFAVDLTQGAGRTFPPICALWVVVMPLCDCVSLMIRRRLSGHSMFAADHQHLHHYLLARGLRVGQATLASAAISLACAAIGLLGWKLAVPEPVLFGGFVALFIGYHLAMTRAFRRLPAPQIPAGDPGLLAR